MTGRGAFHIKWIVAILLLIVASGNAAAQVDHLCFEDELTVWSCERTERIYSICASPRYSDDARYVQYRAGTSSNINFRFPAELRHPAGYFEYATLARSALVLFSNEGYEYYITEPLRGRTSIEVVKDGEQLSHFTCTNATGTLTLNETRDLFRARTVARAPRGIGAESGEQLETAGVVPPEPVTQSSPDLLPETVKGLDSMPTVDDDSGEVSGQPILTSGSVETTTPTVTQESIEEASREAFAIWQITHNWYAELPDTKRTQLLQIGALTLISVVVLVFFLVSTRRVVFYYDRSDAMWSVAVFAIPLISVIIAAVLMPENATADESIIPMMVVSGGLLGAAFAAVVSIWNAIRYNRSLFLGLLVGVFKVVIGLLMLLTIIGIFSNTTDRNQRLRDRAFALAVFALIVGIFWKLFVNGTDVEKRRRLAEGT